MLEAPGSYPVQVVGSLLQGDGALPRQEVVVGPVGGGGAERVVVEPWILMVMLHVVWHELLLVEHHLVLIPTLLFSI
jgi:hypothetical protein